MKAKVAPPTPPLDYPRSRSCQMLERFSVLVFLFMSANRKWPVDCRRPPFVRRLAVRRRRFREAFLDYERAKAWLNHIIAARLQHRRWCRKRGLLRQAKREVRRARNRLVWANRIAFDEEVGTQRPSSESTSPSDVDMRRPVPRPSLSPDDPV